MTLSTFEKTLSRGKATRPCPRFLERTVIEAQREFYDLIFHRSRHAIVLFVISGSGWQLAKREMHEITRHPFILSLSLFVPTGEKCFTIKLCDRRLSNISRTRPPLKAPTIELGKTSWLNHRRVSVSPSTFASAIDLSRLSRENWGGPNVSRLFFPLNRQERNSGGCNSFYINREISIEF